MNDVLSEKVRRAVFEDINRTAEHIKRFYHQYYDIDGVPVQVFRQMVAKRGYIKRIELEQLTDPRSEPARLPSQILEGITFDWEGYALFMYAYLYHTNKYLNISAEYFYTNMLSDAPTGHVILLVYYLDQGVWEVYDSWIPHDKEHYNVSYLFPTLRDALEYYAKFGWDGFREGGLITITRLPTEEDPNMYIADGFRFRPAGEYEVAFNEYTVPFTSKYFSEYLKEMLRNISSKEDVLMYEGGGTLGERIKLVLKLLIERFKYIFSEI